MHHVAWVRMHGSVRGAHWKQRLLPSGHTRSPGRSVRAVTQPAVLHPTHAAAPPYDNIHTEPAVEKVTLISMRTLAARARHSAPGAQRPVQVRPESALLFGEFVSVLSPPLECLIVAGCRHEQHQSVGRLS